MDETNSQVPTSSPASRMQPYLIPGAILIAGVFISLGIFFSNVYGRPMIQDQANLGEEEQPAGDPKAVAPVDATDHTKGSPDAPVTLIEFSDFQCPFCERFHPTVARLLKEYEGRVRVVYRHLPLTMIHPEAQPAAEASECIAELGGEEAFWKFADAAFANQKKLGAAFYEQMATSLGVDQAAFVACMDSDRHVARIEAHTENALASGARGTPYTVVFNTEGTYIPLSGALPYEAVKSAVDSLLK